MYVDSNFFYLIKYMPNVTINTAEEFKRTRFCTRLIELTSVLNLPLPSITTLQLTKFERKDLWGFRVTRPGRQAEPPMEAITFKLMHDDKERGLDVFMHELLGRLVGRHSTELRGLYFHPFGRRDEDGEAIDFEDNAREIAEPIRLYLQDLESLIRHLDNDRTNVMLSNDELRVQLKDKGKAFEEQEKRIKDMEKKFEG